MSETHLDDPAAYEKRIKLHRANKHEVHCAICPYHKGENATRKVDRKRKKKSKFRRRG